MHPAFSKTWLLVLSACLMGCGSEGERSKTPEAVEDELEVVSKAELDSVTPAAPVAELPKHEVKQSALSMKTGLRVQIDVPSDITKDQCSALVAKYSRQGVPDGQVSVHKPSAKINGLSTPWCVENFDGSGLRFNDEMF